MNPRRTNRLAAMLVAVTLTMPSCTEVRASRSEVGAGKAVHSVDVPVPVRQRGVSWVGSREIDGSELDILAEVNVNWIVQTPFGWQSTLDDPEIRLTHGSNRNYWGETDAGIESTTRHARERGIRTLLKPHLWVRRGAWPGDIAMQTEEDWTRWFENYRAFILHYARLAETNGIEALCVGTELRIASTTHPEQWRSIIAEVRSVYSGRLTYAANWHEEFDVIEFWDDLDFIGVQAYFPLVRHERPTREELEAGWAKHIPGLEQVSRRFDKPIVFTEIGYRSIPAAAIEPWTWPERNRKDATLVDIATQAACYEAFFSAVWGRSWIEGAYVWKWYPRHESAGGLDDVDFTPQNKPAQDVIARWYGRG